MRLGSGEAVRATALHPSLHLRFHPLVLAMWRCARRLAVPARGEDAMAGVVGQPGATPAFWQLRRHKPTPRSSPSLWGSPQAALIILASDKENICGPTSSR